MLGSWTDTEPRVCQQGMDGLIYTYCSISQVYQDTLGSMSSGTVWVDFQFRLGVWKCVCLRNLQQPSPELLRDYAWNDNRLLPRCSEGPWKGSILGSQGSISLQVDNELFMYSHSEMLCVEQNFSCAAWMLFVYCFQEEILCVYVAVLYHTEPNTNL